MAKKSTAKKQQTVEEFIESLKETAREQRCERDLERLLAIHAEKEK